MELPQRGLFFRTGLSAIRFAAPVLSLGILLLGCNVRVEDALKSESGDGDSAASLKSTNPEQKVDPETLLTSAVEVLLSPRRGPDVYRLAADRINYYFRTRPEGERAEYGPPGVVLDELRQRLPRELYVRVSSDQFDAGDGLYLGTQLILRRIVDFVVGDRRGFDALELLFDWTVRSVPTLRADRERTEVVPLFYTLMGSHGTAVERAWLFHDLVMQLGMPACVLSVPADEGGEAEPWCVGVVLDSEMYLFDSWRLTPILLPDGTPATLSAIAGQPEVLKKLAELDGDYPDVANHLNDLVAWIGTTPECWSARIRHLEARLAGPYRARLSLDMPSLVQAVRDAGRGHIASVELWPAPNEAALTVRSRSGQALVMQVLGPAAFVPVQEARLHHLLGDFDAARQQYLDLREPVELQGQLPPEAEQLRQAVREFATYAMAQLKSDEGDWAIAREWLTRSYLGRYGKDAPWAPGAYTSIGQCLERQGKHQEAVTWYLQPEALERVPELVYRATAIRWRYRLPEVPSASEPQPASPDH